jgi:hypothetical protein
MEDAVVHVGDPVSVDVVVENYGDEARAPFISVPANDFRITLRDSNGDPVPWSKFGQELQGNEPGHYGGSSGPVPARAIWRFRFRLEILADLTKAGDYTTSVGLDVGGAIGSIRPNSPSTKPSRQYPDHTRVESNQVRFTIIEGASSRPASPDRLVKGNAGQILSVDWMTDDSRGHPETKP